MLIVPIARFRYDWNGNDICMWSVSDPTRQSASDRLQSIYLSLSSDPSYQLDSKSFYLMVIVIVFTQVCLNSSVPSLTTSTQFETAIQVENNGSHC